MRWYWWLLLSFVLVVGLLFLPIVPPAHSQVSSITLEWTAPGDDGMVGTATTYAMRFSTTRPDTTSSSSMDAWWAAALPVPVTLPSPLIAGTSQTTTIPGAGFITGTHYYFVMRAADEVPNWSNYSNVADFFVPDTTPPSRIIDLVAHP